MKRIKSHKIVLLDRIYDGYIYFEGGQIIEVSNNELEVSETYDYSHDFVLPGFIESHTHGAGGCGFLNSDVKDIVKACNTHLKHGTTAILPTITTASFDEMYNSIKNIKEASNDNPNIIGVHLEGPYLSKKQCGAQNPDFITKPIKDEYLKILSDFPSFIKRWTYAPENDLDMEFTRALTNNNVIASIGHSDAKYSEVKKAVESGANLVTHLYSCTSTIIRENGFRVLGVTESAYAFDELSIELIADNRHLPKELLNLAIKTKGVDKVILTTDSLEIAGTDIKKGSMNAIDFIVEDGVAKMTDRSAFVGSIATSDILFRNVIDLGYSINEVSKMMSHNIAQLLHVNKGDIKKGYDADFVILNNNYQIKDVFTLGNKIKEK